MSEGERDTQPGDLGRSARYGTGLATIYRALDRLVDDRGFEDAAIVVEVPNLGRQVLRARRRPLRDDEHGLLDRPPGLYVEPAGRGELGTHGDALLGDLMVALAQLGLRHDTVTLDRARPVGPAAS